MVSSDDQLVGVKLNEVLVASPVKTPGQSGHLKTIWRCKRDVAPDSAVSALPLLFVLPHRRAWEMGETWSLVEEHTS